LHAKVAGAAFTWGLLAALMFKVEGWSPEKNVGVFHTVAAAPFLVPTAIHGWLSLRRYPLAAADARLAVDDTGIHFTAAGHALYVGWPQVARAHRLEDMRRPGLLLGADLARTTVPTGTARLFVAGKAPRRDRLAPASWPAGVALPLGPIDPRTAEAALARIEAERAARDSQPRDTGPIVRR
jgi:hypothetical protein